MVSPKTSPLHGRTLFVEYTNQLMFTVFWTCAAGDSRAILIKRGGKVKVMSIDHRPDRYIYVTELLSSPASLI